MAKVHRVDFSKKKKWLRVVFIAFLAYFGIILISQQFTLNRLNERRENLVNDVDTLEEQNQGLRQQVHWLEADLNYLESVARRILGLVREGEILYILPNPSNKQR